MEVTKEAYEKSIELLRELMTRKGFIASKGGGKNYARIWGRDGVIAGIAALSSEDDELIEGFKKTLETLTENQDNTGRIPSNIPLGGGEVSYGTTVGRIDPTLWYVFGHCELKKRAGDDEFFEKHRKNIESALHYLDCLELNNKGLLYIPHGADWADEYINHGYVLFDELLYLLALRNYGEIAKSGEHLKKAEMLANLIAVNYFPRNENRDSEYVYNKTIFCASLRDYKPPFPVVYFTNHSIRYHRDNFANGLLFASDVMEKRQREELLDAVINKYLDVQFPIMPAFDPVIEEGSLHWAHLAHNYLFEFRNQPYRYHNGGLWPMITGFFLAHAKPPRGKEYLARFAEILARDGYMFPEYYHGLTHEPLGTQYIGLSAAGYILAYKAYDSGD